MGNRCSEIALCEAYEDTSDEGRGQHLESHIKTKPHSENSEGKEAEGMPVRSEPQARRGLLVVHRRGSISISSGCCFLAKQTKHVKAMKRNINLEREAASWYLERRDEYVRLCSPDVD